MASDFPQYQEYMSSAEAERYSGLKGLAKRRVLGTSPPYIKTGDAKGARVLYSKAQIDAWLAVRTRKHTSEHSAAVAQAMAAATPVTAAQIEQFCGTIGSAAADAS